MEHSRFLNMFFIGTTGSPISFPWCCQSFGISLSIDAIPLKVQIIYRLRWHLSFFIISPSLRFLPCGVTPLKVLVWKIFWSPPSRWLSTLWPNFYIKSLWSIAKVKTPTIWLGKITVLKSSLTHLKNRCNLTIKF